jgi:EAL domain-containing protein (putative c-di-GMP-specific phosphodiesterase class I)/GAF domain-containing protein
LSLLRRCDQLLVRACNETELLEAVCRTLVADTDYRLAWVGYPAASVEHVLVPIARAGADAFGYLSPLPLDWPQDHDELPSARAVCQRAPQVLNTIRIESDSISWRFEAHVRGYRSVAAVPLLTDGHCLGALEVYAKHAHAFGAADIELLTGLADRMACAITALRTRAEHAHQRQSIAQLTRSLNLHGALGAAVARARGRGELLRETCRIVTESGGFDQAILSIVTPNSRTAEFDFRTGRRGAPPPPQRITIGRGDEPDTSLTGRALRTGEVLVCPDLARSTLPVLMREQLLADGVHSMVALPVLLEDTRIAAFTLSSRDKSPSCITDVETLRQIGQTLANALRTEREAGGAAEPLVRHARAPRGDRAERLALEGKLRQAMEQQQFEVYYQPQVHIETGRVESLEALLRWNSPEHGILEPAHFLPALESSRLIIGVGGWVLRRAAQDCERWRRLGSPPLRIAVNVSALQVQRRGFVDEVLGVVESELTDPAHYGIDLEITETMLLHDMERANSRLTRLRAGGVRIALDDFGTGCSSLSLLSHLPADLLKIDRGFVRGLPRDRASVTLTRSIVGLASEFGLRAVAEGVETPEQLELLRAMKCDYSQGYVHCPPVAAPEIDVILLERGSQDRYDAANRVA